MKDVFRDFITSLIKYSSLAGLIFAVIFLGIVLLGCLTLAFLLSTAYGTIMMILAIIFSVLIWAWYIWLI